MLKKSKTKTDSFLHKHIILLLILKVLAIWLIWWLFFSEPLTHKMQMPIGSVDKHFFKKN